MTTPVNCLKKKKGRGSRAELYLFILLFVPRSTSAIFSPFSHPPSTLARQQLECHANVIWSKAGLKYVPLSLKKIFRCPYLSMYEQTFLQSYLVLKITIFHVCCVSAIPVLLWICLYLSCSSGVALEWCGVIFLLLCPLSFPCQVFDLFTNYSVLFSLGMDGTSWKGPFWVMTASARRNCLN